MLGSGSPGHFLGALNQIMADSRNRDFRIDLVDKVSALLAGIEAENHVGIIRYVDIGVIVPIENPACFSVNSPA